MRDRTVANRYARALLEAAKAEGVLEGVAESYAAILELHLGRTDLRIFLESPQVATDEKEQLLDALFKGRVEDLMLRFIHMLLHKNRVEHFRDIGEEFAVLVESARGFRRAVCVTAIPLPGDLEATLQSTLEKITGGKIILEKKVDPEVIGGVCVTLGDKILDGTVRTNLDLLREHLGRAQVR